jgi:plasmid stabilization system protein ParE
MEKKTVIFSRQSEEDIESIVSYIAEDSPGASRAFRKSIRHTCSLLVEMPGMGLLRSFGNSKLTDIRLWPLKRFEKYLLIYRILGSDPRGTRGAQPAGSFPRNSE